MGRHQHFGLQPSVLRREICTPFDPFNNAQQHPARTLAPSKKLWQLNEANHADRPRNFPSTVPPIGFCFWECLGRRLKPKLGDLIVHSRIPSDPARNSILNVAFVGLVYKHSYLRRTMNRTMLSCRSRDFALAGRWNTARFYVLYVAIGKASFISYFAQVQYYGIILLKVQPKECPSVIIVLLQTEIDRAIESSHEAYRDGLGKEKEDNRNCKDASEHADAYQGLSECCSRSRYEQCQLSARRGVPEAASQATPCRKLAAALVSMSGDLSQAISIFTDSWIVPVIPVVMIVRSQVGLLWMHLATKQRQTDDGDGGDSSWSSIFQATRRSPNKLSYGLVWNDRFTLTGLEAITYYEVARRRSIAHFENVILGPSIMIRLIVQW
ncbi:hypothetical protein EDD22DRAFT_843898 [Suillus occidentalis]|nr:hypothetical protein EDD22DRAFT_843898 [Suillus occidentalis]